MRRGKRLFFMKEAAAAGKKKTLGAEGGERSDAREGTLESPKEKNIASIDSGRKKKEEVGQTNLVARLPGKKKAKLRRWKKKESPPGEDEKGGAMSLTPRNGKKGELFRHSEGKWCEELLLHGGGGGGRG